MKETNLTRQHSRNVAYGLVSASAARSYSWVEELDNDSGVDIVEGDVVVVIDDGSIELAATANDPRPTGIALDDIDDGDSGQVCFGGPVGLVHVTASVTAGNAGRTSTTPGEAAEVTGGVSNAFCYFTTSGTSPAAFLWGGRGGGLTGGTGAGSGSPGWFNVRDYGAVGDGVTDDRGAFQDANDAATAAGNGIVYAPQGSYLIGSPGLALDPNNSLLGDGRESTFLLAGADSINIVTVTGTTADSAFEADGAETITGIQFDANGHTGCIGISWIGVDYHGASRCTFRNFTGNGTTGGIAQHYYGSLQGVTYDCKFTSNTTAIRYEPTTIGYWGGIIPPNRDLVSWCTFYFNAKHAIDHTGGAQLFVDYCEFGSNGTVGDATTSAVAYHDADYNNETAHGLTVRGGWFEGSLGLAGIVIGPSDVGYEHSITDTFFPTNDATYAVSVDGSDAMQYLVTDRLLIADAATTRGIHRSGGSTFLDLRNSTGVLAGSGGVVRQDPLLDQTNVIDWSQMLALRLPNLTTTERDAIATPTAGMLIWNTTTTSVQRYSGSAWATVGGVSVLDDLSDVTITSPATGDLVQYDGAAWVNVGAEDAGHYEILMASGSADPLETSDGLDYLYVWIPA